MCAKDTRALRVFTCNVHVCKTLKQVCSNVGFVTVQCPCPSLPFIYFISSYLNRPSTKQAQTGRDLELKSHAALNSRRRRPFIPTRMGTYLAGRMKNDDQRLRRR